MPEPKINNNDKTLSELERQLERSGFFTHSSLSNQAERINEIESFLYGLLDTLIAQDLLDKKRFEETVKKVRDETLQKKEHFHACIAISEDNNGEASHDFDPVNCEERLGICKGICCKLNFALSIDEIESGKIKWDLGQPYFIRQNTNGYCYHLDLEKHCCSIYADRPKVCFKYSCANDKRIWKDFEKMEFNYEWVEENLKERKIQLEAVYMIPEDKVTYKSKID
ncbi:MAG: YkgJ family cysteine cluster protein [Deltaproteobacteria bacterium]|nr:YkgJ family cysteine cluster protein [Deltaproteobacteria bacterium]